MKANISHVFGLAIIAVCIAVQAPSRLVYSSGGLSSAVEPLPSGPGPTPGDRPAISYGDLPLSFEVNRGQADARVEFFARAGGYTVYLTAQEAVMSLHAPGCLSSKNERRPSARTTEHSSSIGVRMVGANTRARVVGLDELPGKSNYFIGADPKKWRLNVPNYSRVKYQNAYPGVDVVFYGEGHQLEYDFIVAPGASFKPVRISFEGARRVRLDKDGDLVIETVAGEIHQPKPAIYQQAGDKRLAINGGYVSTREGEVAFEVGAYDRTLALVIDPVLVYSTTIGGIYNDNANAIAVDTAGNAYIAGMTTSTDFPTVNPFQAKLKIGEVGISSDAFVTKLNAAGTAVLYSTYLGGGGGDAANSIAVDTSGNAYVTGYTGSTDFPTSPGAFQTNASSFGDAFVTKLNPAGNALGYSTRLGGPPSSFGFSFVANNGLGIAVNSNGNAYVTGYTFSPSFPVKKAAQAQLDRGSHNMCCFPECLYSFVPGPIPVEDAFVTKLNPSGTGLVYSTYVGGTAQEEGFAIAIDASESAYITGRTCSRDFTNGAYGGGKSDAFAVKVSPSGKQFVYSRLIGGSGDDLGNSIAVDSTGNAYVAGQSDSGNLITSQSAYQPVLGGSVSYVTNDGGASWTPGSGLPNTPVASLAVDPVNPLTVYAGLGLCSKEGGVFKSSDGGNTWRASGLAGRFIRAIVIDPKNPSTVYADISKSTDGGATWAAMVFPQNPPVVGASKLAIDPVNTTTLYMVSDGGSCGEAAFPPAFLRTTDGGHTWDNVRNGGNTFGASSVFFDPKNPSIIYAINGNLFKSTDSGSTWRIPYEGNRNLVGLAIDPNNTSTLYLTELVVNLTPPFSLFDNLLKSTDAGTTFVTLISKGPFINSLAIDSTNTSRLYAAIRVGENGGVIKSTDGGLTWSATDLNGILINTLALDSLNSRLYAGAFFDTDGFIAKVNQDGSALVYSTYLGTRSRDVVAGIAIDGARNTYVTGQTLSDRFPSKDPLFATKPSGPFDTSAFVTKLNATGSAILFSSYLGFSEPGFSSAIAVDGASKAYVAGTTGSPAIVPSARLPESAHGGSDAFVVKLGSPPQISGASISGKNLIVTGEGFDEGAAIIVGGVEQKTKNDQSSPATTLIGKKSAKSIAPGQSVTIQVRNSDGLISEPFGFTR